MKRAYSTLEIKAVSDVGGKRTFTGIASTPSTDRMGDIVDPKGAQFKLPLPLLWQHDSEDPVGHVVAARVSKDGIEVDCEIASIDEPGDLQDRLTMAWQMLKTKLVRGLSIGFNPIEDEPIDPKSPWGSTLFSVWDWLELSCVTIPANQDASIQTIKSIDTKLLAATGHKQVSVVRLGSTPGDSGKRKSPEPKGNQMKPKISDQVASFEAKKVELQEKRATLMSEAAEKGSTLDAEQKEQYETAGLELKEVTEHVARLKEQENEMASQAVPVQEKREVEVTQSTRKPIRADDIVYGKSQLQKGIGFTRMVLLMAAAKGDTTKAMAMAKRQFGESCPEVVTALRGIEQFGSMSDMVQKTAVAAGTTQDTTFASPLAYANVLASEFVEYMRPATILGKFGVNGIPGLRKAPFNIKIPRQTGGTSGTFVGEGLPKPVGKLAFDLLTMPFAKVATIVVLTDELVRFSNPAAEAIARDDMVAGISQYMDKRFIDPAFAGVANVSPASITNAAAGAASSGNTVAAIDTDIKNALDHFAINPLLSLDNLVWIMNPIKAIALSMLRNIDGTKAYPDVNARGGSLMGIPVITSANVSLSGSPTDSFVVLVDASNILLADDGQVAVDISNEASLQMLDNPSTGAQSLVSLWQNNLVGLRAERYIYWMARQTGAVWVITDTGW